ncbi:MAG: membrane dipeptidase, partial [Acidobacteriota bacterium]
IAITHTAIDTPHGRRGLPGGMLPRLVSREHARAVAAAGGIVGVWKSFPTLVDFVIGIKEMADVVGIDHVGIGTDTYINPAPSASGGRQTTNSLWPEAPGGFVYKIANEMLRQGFAPGEVAGVVGDNFCRVFGSLAGPK